MNYQLLAPAFLCFSAAAVVPLILHLLRHREHTPRPFPSFAFLTRVQRISDANNRWRKRLVLFFRCLGLALLALAFCRPHQATHIQAPPMATIILWDDSASVSAVKEQLRRKLAKEMKNCAPDAPVQIGLVRANRRIQWSGGFSGDRKSLLKWFDDNAICQSGSDFGGVGRICSAKFNYLPAPQRRVVVFSDGTAAPWRSFTRGEFANATVCRLDTVEPPTNDITLRVNDISIDRGRENLGVRLTVKVINRTKNTIDNLELTAVDSKKNEVGRTVVPLSPQEEREVIFEFSLPPGDNAAGQVSAARPQDALQLDNTAFFAARGMPTDRLTVLAPPEGEFDFLAAALDSGDVDFSQWRVPSGAQSGKILFCQGAQHFNAAGMEKIDAFLNAGGQVAILPSADNRGLSSFLKRHGVIFDRSAADGEFHLAPPDTAHPALNAMKKWEKFSGWFHVIFFRRHTAQLPDDAEIVLTFDDGETLLAGIPASPGMIWLFLGEWYSDNSNWPKSATFLPFWRIFSDYCIQCADTPAMFSVGDVYNGRVLERVGCFTDENGSTYAVNPPYDEIESIGKTGKVPALTPGNQPLEPDEAGITADNGDKPDEPTAILLLLTVAALMIELTISNRSAL